LYTATLEYIVCGDINIDYITDSDRKCPLDALIITYNLKSTVNFPTRIKKIPLELLTTFLLTSTWSSDLDFQIIIKVVVLNWFCHCKLK
jgi:hypothetical protein